MLVYVPLVVGTLQALATVLSAFATNSAISDFLAGSRTVDAAQDVATHRPRGLRLSCSACPARWDSRSRS